MGPEPMLAIQTNPMILGHAIFKATPRCNKEFVRCICCSVVFPSLFKGYGIQPTVLVEILRQITDFFKLIIAP